MTPEIKDYILFLKFIETFAPTGFKNIDRNHPLILELEEFMKITNQYFFIADLFQGQLIFTSQRSIDLIGIEADELTPYHAIEAAHPEEVYRNTMGWSKLLQLGNNLLTAKKGQSLLSVNMKLRNPKSGFSEILFQCYLFYSGAPNNKVYELQIHTNIDGFALKKHEYHYYVGNDFNNFRYPDKELLATGNPLSNREFEIIKLIAACMNSEQIAENLFLSVHTVNTHRRNILEKTGKAHISELIYDLKEQGLL